MRQYDKIGIPGPNFTTPWVASHGPFIVLTVEEVKDLWTTAYHNGIDRQKGKDVSLHLEAYLQSKGIQITDK